jgi:1-deoxy-D-xylulose-5-phosphate synthase
MFQLPAQRQLPNLIIASPADEQELRRLLRTAFGQPHPIALHYPRDAGFDLPTVDPTPIPVGTGELLRDGTDLLIVGLGPIVRRGLEVADLLARDGWSSAVLNARFAKPLDTGLLLRSARGKRLVVTLEESALPGGFGSGVLETLADEALRDPALRDIPVVRIGLPDDGFVDHGSVADLRRHVRLDVPGISEQVHDAIAEVGITPLMASAHLEARPA